MIAVGTGNATSIWVFAIAKKVTLKKIAVSKKTRPFCAQMIVLLKENATIKQVFVNASMGSKGKIVVSNTKIVLMIVQVQMASALVMLGVNAPFLL